MVHHQLVRQSTSGLSVLDLFVDQTVHYGNAAVDAEGICHLLVEVVKVAAFFVAQLCHAHNTVFIPYGKAQDVARLETGGLVHAFVE